MKSSRMFMRGLILALLAWAGLAWSSTFKPIALSRLVERSPLVVVATPVSRTSHWVMIGTRSRLVTDFTLEVSWTLRGQEVTGNDIVVRLLGGSANGLAQIVYGEARLVVGQTSLLFLVPDKGGTLRVSGMAQGQFPTEPDEKGEWRLRRSSGLDGVIHPERSAVEVLAGKRLLDVPKLLDNAEVSP